MPGDEFILDQARFDCHGLNTICKTIFIRLLYGSKYDLVRSVTA